jgi:hypothetical protein
MRKTLLLLILLLLSSFTYAQNKYATTTDGERVLLKSDGTWEYVTIQPTTNSATQVNHLSSGSSSTTSAQKTNTVPARKSTSRKYIRGPRGGCYYINGNGNKTYVDRSLCK